MSQVLLVDINPPIPEILPDAETSFILKVYDPRFLQHRQGSKSSAPHPWTLAAETIAARRREFGADTYLPTWWPDDSDTAGWEQYYHGNLQQIFKNELAAYTRLLPLQGQSIPLCYAHGTLVLPSPAKRMVVPRVLLLSYVQGPSLRAVHPSRVTPTVARALIDTVRTFGALGVIHDDLRPDNILLSPSEDPSRAFVLDFGNAEVRTDQSDEEWDWTRADNDEPKLVELMLDKLAIDHSA
jgi:serine/threonine protein kinase